MGINKLRNVNTHVKYFINFIVFPKFSSFFGNQVT